MSVDRSDPTTLAQPGDDQPAGAGPEPAPGTAPDPAPLSPEDRKAAFAAGAPRMPRKVILMGVAGLLAIGVTGALADHFATSSTPAPTGSHRSPTGHSGPVVPHHGTAPTVSSELHAPLAAFMGITNLKDAAAAGFTLTDAGTGATVSLSSLSGHVVVLSFANGPCNDICPVLADELAQAEAAMGTTSVPVTFVTINTDPLALAASDAAVLTKTPLGALDNFRFLTGSVKQLNNVWTTYGISITVNRTTKVASHNELMYFITPTQKIAWAATPFANESTNGTYSLPASEISRFARGIARYARKLASTR